ncbi:AMP-binding protein [Psychromonas sp. SP041]|uniref:AMP-binding protein n=1 Tax=Psychromonas sp. SP041 TaxID=1365007 RepID=UPI000419236A|nr:AMP-binding protein [Psychromonas sp. SP041]
MEILINDCPVRWQAIHNNQAIAIACEQRQITYQHLDNLLINLQKQLTVNVNKKEDRLETNSSSIRLVCIASNGLELLLLQLLCIRLGWLFCPLNPRFTDAEIAQRLAILSSYYCWVADDSTHLHFKTVDIDFYLLEKETIEGNERSEITINPSQPCNIIFTSGSSGFPKAIIHHYENHFFSALGSQALIPLNHYDHNLLSLPLFHIGGYATVIRTIIAGACIHLTSSALNVLMLQQQKITHLSLVSTQLIRLLSDPFFTAKECPIKHILLGGSTFSDSLLTSLTARDFDYHLSYGCTEMASQVATSNNSNDLQVLPYREVKIRNNEIYVRGKTRLYGYFQDNNIVVVDPKEWIQMGDIGKITANYLQVLGRKDRQFISGGENIQPEEIERICLQHKSVEKVYIYPIEDQKYGQRIAIFIEFVENEITRFEQQAQILKAYLATQLTRFKQPDVYLAWPQITNQQSLKVPKEAFMAQLKQQKLI